MFMVYLPSPNRCTAHEVIVNPKVISKPSNEQQSLNNGDEPDYNDNSDDCTYSYKFAVA